jgi:hypothetical protein
LARKWETGDGKDQKKRREKEMMLGMILSIYAYAISDS